MNISIVSACLRNNYAILHAMSAHIAVDIGGTQIRAACYAEGSLTPFQLDKVTTQAADTTPLERMVTLIEAIWPAGETVEAIGVAAPGPVNTYEGIIYTAPNIPGWSNLCLSQHLKEKFGVPVLVGNDANLAALGEWQCGAGQGHHHLIYMTVSTGIGTGIIQDDRLILGSKGLAGELGHVTIDPAGPVCSCGQRGHLEAFASGTAIARWVEHELINGVPSSLPVYQKLNARQIAAAANQGDVLAITALARAGTFIGHALADHLHTFNPSIIIIGGGVSRSGELLFAPMRVALRERIISPYYLEDLQLTTAALGDEAGLVGALTLARSATRPKYSKLIQEP
jgi:glucokinase